MHSRKICENPLPVIWRVKSPVGWVRPAGTGMAEPQHVFTPTAAGLCTMGGPGETVTATFSSLSKST